MCRHLAYVGEPVRLADLLLTPPHSLLRQSWAPCDMRGGGTVNADGYGVGWYTGSVPVRLRRAVPMWADASLPGLASTVSSGGVLAAVRSATVGMPVVETACAPFTHGPWLFSHNGVVRGWPSSVAALAARLPVTDLLLMEAPTDSALLWTLLRASLVVEVAAAAPESRLNLLLTDGATIVAAAWTHSLWVRALPGGVVVASEPYDEDPSWQEVADRHLVTATSSTVDITEVGDS